MRIVFIIISVFSIINNNYAQSGKDDFLTGVAFIEQQSYDSSKYYFLSAIDKEEKADFYLLAGKSYYYLQNFDSAIYFLSKANDLQTDISDYFMAKSYARQSNIKLTIHYIESNLSSAYKELRSTILLDDDFEFLENKKEWINLWAANWYSDFEEFIENIDYLLKNNKSFEVLELIKNNETKYPQSSELHSKNAEAYLQLKSYKNAINEYTLAIEYENKNEEYYFNRANIFILLEKNKKAISDISKAIQINPDKLTYFKLRALLYQKEGKIDLAIKDISYYIKYYYMKSNALFVAGKIYYDAQDYIQALIFFNNCIKLDNNIEYYIARGDAYYKTKTYKYALKDFSTALDLNPNNPQIYFKKAFVHLAVGEKDKACTAWKKASEMGYLDAEEYIWKYCQE